MNKAFGLVITFLLFSGPPSWASAPLGEQDPVTAAGPRGWAPANADVADVAPKLFETLPYLLNGYWWSPEEPGWALMIQESRHLSGVVYANWHTYDEAGKAVWLVMPNGQTTGYTIEGDVYSPSGPPKELGLAYDASRFSPGQPVGRFRFDFRLDGGGTFQFDVKGHRGTKAIQRFDIRNARGDLCTAHRGVWWVPSEPGWALSLDGSINGRSGCPVHAVMASYDSTGKPTWYFAGMQFWFVFPDFFTSYEYYRGDAYQPKGSFYGAPYDASRFSLGPSIGSFTIYRSLGGGPPTTEIYFSNSQHVLKLFDF